MSLSNTLPHSYPAIAVGSLAVPPNATRARRAPAVAKRRKECLRSMLGHGVFSTAAGFGNAPRGTNAPSGVPDQATGQPAHPMSRRFAMSAWRWHSLRAADKENNPLPTAVPYAELPKRNLAQRIHDRIVRNYGGPRFSRKLSLGSRGLRVARRLPCLSQPAPGMNGNAQRRNYATGRKFGSQRLAGQRRENGRVRESACLERLLGIPF